jgi:UDP-2,3-diacylglucosamine pyrophosphatase LpxH
MITRAEETPVVRVLDDDTLLVFLSDCHIGGSDGRDIFESPADLARLFAELGAMPGPIELVLAGDFFDFLRIAGVPAGETRASATLARPEYGDLFAALRRFAAGAGRRVTYLPGNHDAEMWWNGKIREALREAGIVHDFALSYAAAYRSSPDRIVYCEHGNEFDPENTIRNYDDPLDTPLGEHIVTDIIPRLPKGWAAEALQLNEIERVFPLATIPGWVAGRLFYALITQAVRWLLLPLLIAYIAYDAFAYLIGHRIGAINAFLVDVAYDAILLIIAFSIFFFVAWRMADRSIRATPVRLRPGAESRPSPTVALIQQRVESGEALPLSGALPSDIAVFVSGHTHAPALAEFTGRGGRRGVIANSGCWLRQLQGQRTHLRAPAVFASCFVQTHVRVRLDGSNMRVELWDHPRPSAQRLRVVERLAVAGRLPAEPREGDGPVMRAALVV